MEKYGSDKVTSALCNEVWFSIRDRPDQYIVDIVSHIMCNKPVYAAKFAAAEFLEVTEYERSSTKNTGWQKPYKAEKKEVDRSFLGRHLKMIGAESLVDAVNKEKEKK